MYLAHWLSRRYVQMRHDETHLHIRCFHGRNTWEQHHFVSKLRNTPRDLFLYGWHRHVRGDVFGHPRFRLSPADRAAFEQYVEDSLELGVFAAAGAPTSVG